MDLGYRDLQSRRLHPSLFNLTALTSLTLAGNDFMGATLPSAGFEQLTEMVHLDFGYANFFGQIPAGIGIARLKNLVTLDFPQMGVLPKLQVLALRSNQFFGTIGSLPENVRVMNHFSSLQILNLASNNFSGSLPEEWFTKLRSIIGTDNDVGQAIGGNPTGINLSYFSRLVDLPYNNLTGRIPQENQFLSFSSNSFEGNPDLCGSQVSKKCDNRGSSSTTPRADHAKSNGLWQDRLDSILLFALLVADLE
ncbi:hypothetical protein U9M48_020861 [Paspalum notatum var. saurae]|uniref:Uncharacterized protein n=1 Tax=Paspalum notatum var. saurae TaxID=547442 RepID=A0AAQ3TGE2_PASNO